jgi:hypothetical protein
MRDRLAEPLSVLEDRAVEMLRGHVRREYQRSGAEKVSNEIIRRAVIWEIDGSTDASPVPAAAIAMLASLMGGRDISASAFRLLRGEAADRARLRSGIDIARALRVLGESGLPLAKLDETSLQRSALSHYRKSVVARARYLPVQGLAAQIPPIPVPDLLDHLWLHIGSDEFGVSHRAIPLAVAVRRRDRFLILGGPGSGKTTALTHLAASLAQDRHAPIPIFIRLQDLARRWRGGEPVVVTNDYISSAVLAEELSEAERDFLADEIRARLLYGGAILLLDGVDELGEFRHDAAHALRSWLDSLPTQVRVVVSSRDTTYASAHVLGLCSYFLGPPRNLDSTLTKALKLASTWDGRPDRDLPPRQWYISRLAWIRYAVRANWPLLDVPLYAMFIVVLAASSKFEDLPKSTAAALHAVVNAVWTRWESSQRRHGLPPLSGLHDIATTTEAMWTTFSVIAGAIDDGSSRRDTLFEAAISHLNREYGLPRGQSRAAARQLLDMWDEAGLLVSSGKEEIVRPSTTVLIEVGKALHAINLPEDEKNEWVRRSIADPANSEILAFAAGLDSSIRRALLHLASRHHHVAAALFVNAPFMSDLDVEPDSDETAALETLVQAAISGPDEEAIPAMLTLAHINLPESWQQRLISDAAPRLPTGWRNVAFAIAASKWPDWNWQNSTNKVEQLAIEIPGLLPQLPHEDNPDVAWRAQAYRRMVFQGAIPENVKPLPAHAAFQWGMGLFAAVEALSEYDARILELGRALADMIPDGGHISTHIDMLVAERSGVPYGSATVRNSRDREGWARRDARAMSAFLKYLAELDVGQAEPVWSLQPLVRVLLGSGLDPEDSGIITAALTAPYDDVIEVIRTVARLYGLDFAVLSATAREALSIVRPLPDREEMLLDHLWLYFLSDNEEEAPSTVRPNAVLLSDHESGEAINTLVDTYSSLMPVKNMAGVIALEGLQRLPDAYRVKTAKVIRDRLATRPESISAMTVAPLARLACDLDEGSVHELSAHSDPLVRVAVADTVTHLVICKSLTRFVPLLKVLAADVDGAVRAALIEHVAGDFQGDDQDLPDLLQNALSAGTSSEIAAWSCASCGDRGQSIEADSCIKCGATRSTSLIRQR